MMKNTWITPGLFGVALGVATAALLGVTVGGWQTARDSADGSDAAVTAALVPVCLDKSNRDPSRDARIALLRQASLTTWRDLLMDTGWATMPGSQVADRDLAQACLIALDIPES